MFVIFQLFTLFVRKASRMYIQRKFIFFGTLTFCLLNLCQASYSLETRPVQKFGSCPFGYHQSGNYCVPSNNSSNPAIIKDGSCPFGFHQSGSYCLANKQDPQNIIIKNGSCPFGYHQSGGYCLEN